jgi:hypothetical protein
VNFQIFERLHWIEENGMQVSMASAGTLLTTKVEAAKRVDKSSAFFTIYPFHSLPIVCSRRDDNAAGVATAFHSPLRGGASRHASEVKPEVY